jgi:hypothetical protein
MNVFFGAAILIFNSCKLEVRISYMRNILLSLCMLLICTNAKAQIPLIEEQNALSGQIDAVYQVQQQKEMRENEMIAAQRDEAERKERQYLAEKRAEQLRAERIEKEAKAAKNALILKALQIESETRAAEIELQNKKDALSYADKKREQDYEDKRRDLLLRKEEARLKRENDFIDQELKEKAANTDVVQSKADVNRNLSSGQKTLLEKVGEAEVKKNSGFFK